MSDTPTGSASLHPSAEAEGSQAAPVQDRPKRPRKDFLPQQLTPKMIQAIRLVAGGMARKDAALQVGLKHLYLTRVLSAPIGRAELARVVANLEKVSIDKMTAPAGQTAAPALSEASLEVEAAVIEAIRELRKIMKTSRSDVAKAAAAKQILELAQAGKRLAAQQAPEEEGVLVVGEDEAFLRSAISDLRLISAGQPPAATTPASPAATEADAPQAAPEPDSTVLPPAWTERVEDAVVEGGLPTHPESSEE